MGGFLRFTKMSGLRYSRSDETGKESGAMVPYFFAE